MPSSTENLGETTPFSPVINHEIERQGSRAAVEQVTGISEQNQRRWGEQGQWPSLRALYETRDTWSLEMLCEFGAMFFSGIVGLKVTFERADRSPPVHATLSGAMVNGVQPKVLQLAQAIDRMDADGIREPHEIANVEAIAMESVGEIQQLAVNALQGSTVHLGRRRQRQG